MQGPRKGIDLPPIKAPDGLRLDRADGSGVATLWMDRPERRNALALRHWQALPDLLADAAEGARVVVLRGAGGTFCAGADVGEFATARAPGAPAAAYEAANEAAFRAVRLCPVPTVAALEGAAFGGGFGLAAACDLRLTTRTARFAVPAGRLGLAYPVEAMADIVAAVGPAPAKRMLMTGATFDAMTLHRWGAVLEPAEEPAFEDGLNALLTDVAALAPLSLRAAKAAIDAVRLGDAALAEEARRLGERTFASRDYAEGLAAFAQRRAPDFSGS